MYMEEIIWAPVTWGEGGKYNGCYDMYMLSFVPVKEKIMSSLAAEHNTNRWEIWLHRNENECRVAWVSQRVRMRRGKTSWKVPNYYYIYSIYRGWIQHDIAHTSVGLRTHVTKDTHGSPLTGEPWVSFVIYLEKRDRDISGANSRNTPYLTLTGEPWVSFVIYLGKSDRDISGANSRNTPYLTLTGEPWVSFVIYLGKSEHNISGALHHVSYACVSQFVSVGMQAFTKRAVVLHTRGHRTRHLRRRHLPRTLAAAAVRALVLSYPHSEM